MDALKEAESTEINDDENAEITISEEDLNDPDIKRENYQNHGYVYRCLDNSDG